VPVLSRWRHEVREPAQKIERRAFDDAMSPRARGLPPAARALVIQLARIIHGVFPERHSDPGAKLTGLTPLKAPKMLTV
jgi:hypothetical protein